MAPENYVSFSNSSSGNNQLERLEFILNSMEDVASIGSYQVELPSWKFHFSPGLYRLFGEEPGSIEPSMEFINSRSTPGDAEAVRKVLDRAAKDKQPYYYVRRIHTKEGRWRTIESNGKVICDPDGNLKMFFGVVRDITELEESRRLIQSIFDTRLVGIAIHQAVRNEEHKVVDFQILFVNKELEHLTGQKDMVGKLYAQEFPGIKVTGVFDLMLQVIETGRPGQMEYKYRHEGFDKWFSSMFVKLGDGLIATNLDITESKQKEEENNTNQILLKQTEDTAKSGSWNYDLETGDFSWSEAMYNLFHVDKEVKVKPEIYRQFIVPDERSKLEEKVINKIKEELEDFDEELTFLIEGERRLIQIKATAIKDSTGKVTNMLGIDLDVTEKRNAEETLRNNEFMKALLEKKDEFMSVASHELKTPITTLKASLQILCRLVQNHSAESLLLVFAKKANIQADKVISLINDLMDNARIQAGKMGLKIQSFYFQEVIDDCIAFKEGKHNIIVQNDLKDVAIEADKNRIEQVLTNFLSNAIKYSPEGKDVIVTATQEANEAKVEVTDFGIGIPASKIPYVFDRFFRVEETSRQYSGLGLGLFISSEIIQLHKGSCGVVSEVNKGSTFWFKIPLRQKQL